MNIEVWHLHFDRLSCCCSSSRDRRSQRSHSPGRRLARLKRRLSGDREPPALIQKLSKSFSVNCILTRSILRNCCKKLVWNTLIILSHRGFAYVG